MDKKQDWEVPATLTLIPAWIGDLQYPWFSVGSRSPVFEVREPGKNRVLFRRESKAGVTGLWDAKLLYVLRYRYKNHHETEPTQVHGKTAEKLVPIISAPSLYALTKDLYPGASRGAQTSKTKDIIPSLKKWCSTSVTYSKYLYGRKRISLEIPQIIEDIDYEEKEELFVEFSQVLCRHMLPDKGAGYTYLILEEILSCSTALELRLLEIVSQWNYGILKNPRRQISMKFLDFLNYLGIDYNQSFRPKRFREKIENSMAEVITPMTGVDVQFMADRVVLTCANESRMRRLESGINAVEQAG